MNTLKSIAFSVMAFGLMNCTATGFDTSGASSSTPAASSTSTLAGAGATTPSNSQSSSSTGASGSSTAPSVSTANSNSSALSPTPYSTPSGATTPSTPSTTPTPSPRCTLLSNSNTYQFSYQAIVYANGSMNSAASCLAICEANPLAHVCVFTQFSNGGSCGVYDTNLTLPLLNLNGLNIGGTDTTWTCNSTSEPASGTPQDFVNAVYSSILEQAPSAAQLAAATNDTSLSGCAKIVTNVVNSSAAAQLFNGDALGYDIVNRFYHGILGRPSDAGGFHAYWQVMVNDYLQSQAYGASQIAASMTASTSTEFIARCQAFGFKN